MPPKIKITKEDIIATAISLVRERGAGAINARAIAVAQNCSTQPIFTNFATMEELQGAVLIAAYDCYLAFLKKEAESSEYPRYKACGMAYIRFAKEEKELFKLLFMRDRNGEGLIPTDDFEALVEMIMKANDITREKARLLHMEMWTCVHGIATMIATSFLALDWEIISDILNDVYLGVRARHLSEGKEDECNKN